ncbi:MAG: hypothetical protein GX838_03455 [Clostridiaceae bacterium]|nr:hypothetical protein [Clostridiaceae bacterium]
MSKKDKKERFVDDGRVIADMSVDGMPGPLFLRKARKQQAKVTDQLQVKLTKREYITTSLGMISSYVIFGLVVFGGFALFILFCIKVWFK